MTEETQGTTPEQPQPAPAEPAAPRIFDSLEAMLAEAPPSKGDYVYSVEPAAWLNGKPGDGHRKFVKAVSPKEAGTMVLSVKRVTQKALYDAGMALLAAKQKTPPSGS